MIVMVFMVIGCGRPNLEMPPELLNSARDSSGEVGSSANFFESEESVSGEESNSEPVDPFLRINEVLYDVAGSDTDGLVFVELRGTPMASIGGAQIVCINGDNAEATCHISLPKGAQVTENGLYVIADARNGVDNVSQVAKFDILAQFDPQNGPDALQLMDAKGNLLDALGYGVLTRGYDAQGREIYKTAPANDAGSGESLSRLDGATDTGVNASDFVINISPSPGEYEVTVSNAE